MERTVEPSGASGTVGRVLHAALFYDVVAWLFMGGRERAFRRKPLDLAGVQAGECVLDVGCGTGTLALAAKQRVGASGVVLGIDPSPEMVARARRKAARAGVDVVFEKAAVEALPFPDGQFDVVLSTLMMHHLPRAVRRDAAREIRRVLRPGGRVLVADFMVSSQQRRGLLAHLHRHGRAEPTGVAEVLNQAGLRQLESGPLGMRDIHFVLAAAPDGAERIPTAG